MCPRPVGVPVVDQLEQISRHHHAVVADTRSSFGEHWPDSLTVGGRFVGLIAFFVSAYEDAFVARPDICRTQIIGCAHVKSPLKALWVFDEIIVGTRRSMLALHTRSIIWLACFPIRADVTSSGLTITD